MADIIWCKKCDTVNYLDPYTFWNWEGKVKCSDCGTVYYVHMIQGHMYRGPEERPGEEPDILPLHADKPNHGYEAIPAGTPGKAREYQCLPREIYLGHADHRRFSIRGRPVRGWPQPPSTGIAGSAGYSWDIEKLTPEVWQEYQEKLARGEVRDW